MVGEIMNHGTIVGMPRRIAILRNHLPRQCGIATFTTDLSGAVAAEVSNADCVARRYLQSFDRACSREQSAPRVNRALDARVRHV